MEKMYLIDLDGTMYRGSQIIPGAKEFIDYLQESGQRFAFLTNNAKRTRKQNVEHMEKMGFTGIEGKHFYTSSMAAASYTHSVYGGETAWYIGQDGLKEALEEEGYMISDQDADMVFIGLDTEATYEKYCKAISLLLKGAKLIGTNNDRLLAREDGFGIGNGSIVKMFEHATGQTSPKIGKPYTPILEEALKYFQVSREDIIIVGDNLDTDILLGERNDVDTIFVTTGIHTREDLKDSHCKPTRIVDDLRELIPANM